MPTFSHSKISTFEQCSLKYKFSYIDHFDLGVEGIEAFMGSIVHTSLEKLYKDMMGGTILGLHALLDFYKATWEQEYHDGIQVVKKGMTPDMYKQKGASFIIGYYTKHHPFDHAKTLVLESQKLVPLDVGNQYFIHVRIDRLALAPDGTFEIHDYKTSSKLPTQEQADTDRQLAVYAYGIRKLYPEAQKIRLIWHYLAHNTDLVSYRTDAQIESMKEQVLAAVREIESTTEFVPKTSALCNWCEFKSICPAWNEDYKEKQDALLKKLHEEGKIVVNNNIVLEE